MTAPASAPSSLRVFASVSRAHIVAIAALGTFTFGWLLYGERFWWLSAVCALDWFLVNLLNRVVDLREDALNGITGTDFVARHARGLLRGGFALLFGSLLVGAFLVPALTPLRVAFHALGFAYNWAILPGRRRIKQLYFWKNTASAVGFLLTVFGYPMAAFGWGHGLPLAPGITPTTLVFAATFFFLFELSYEVIYDLRDADGDRAAGVATYPVVHGERAAIHIVDGLIITSLLVLLGGYAAGFVPWRIVVMALAPLLQLVLYKRALRRGLRSRDCITLTWLGAALLCAYHLWIAVGLPGVDS